jgi:DNA-binding GntR family transcriptional regulator
MGGAVTAELQTGLDAPSLVELAVRRLRAEIVGGAFAPGERLVEEQLTRRFGISRAPLREALRLLGQQGLVEHLPRRGVRVVQLSSRDIDELFSLRDVLERFALQCALDHDGVPDPSGLIGAQAAVERMERAVGGEASEQAASHQAFHRSLVALAGHQHLLRVYEPVLLQLQLYMATNMRREAEQRPATEGAKRHRRLYEAVVGGDLDVVLNELERHGSRTYLAPELGRA